MAKIRGYHYQIVEMYPNANNEDCVAPILTFDCLEAATEVLEVLEKHNYNYTVYVIMLKPVWDMKGISKEAVDELLSGRDWEKVEEELPDPPF